MTNHTEKAREILDDPRNFSKDPIVGPIPMHFNALYGILAEALAEAERRGMMRAAEQMRAYQRAQAKAHESALDRANAAESANAALVGALDNVTMEPLVQDERGGCVWCGWDIKGRLGQDDNPKHHAKDCAYIAARQALSATPARAKLMAAVVEQAKNVAPSLEEFLDIGIVIDSTVTDIEKFLATVAALQAQPEDERKGPKS